MGLDDDIAILAGAPVFGHFDRDALRLLSFAAERRELRDGERLFAKGDPADGGFVVMSGTIRLIPQGSGSKGSGSKSGGSKGGGSEGGEPVKAARSALIGHLALFVRGERPCDAFAEGPCELVRITPTLMRRVLEEFPSAAQAIHDAMALELVAFTDALDRIRSQFDGA